VKERPILFSGPMVRALLDGRKTQTRRICREPIGQHLQCPDEWGMFDEDGDWFSVSAMNAELFWASPHGAPGDRLWVRETWAWSGDETIAPHAPRERLALGEVWFRADERHIAPNIRWRPSIHMPRWASRITLELTAVRVERLQDISEADAKAEAAPCAMVTNLYPEECGCFAVEDEHRHHFALLWDSLNAKRAPKHIRRRPPRGKPVDRYEETHREEPPGPYAWASNPWVWVLEFGRVTP
jgi:hypothetical protein